jgi:hypothetical protein
MERFFSWFLYQLLLSRSTPTILDSGALAALSSFLTGARGSLFSRSAKVVVFSNQSPPSGTCRAPRAKNWVSATPRSHPL